MMKMFKKGSYKISIVAVGLLVVLGTTALTNATSLKGEVNKKKISAQNITEKKEFEIESTRKFFNNLDRAKDFVDFEFKVLDFIPVGHEFYGVTLDESNIMSIEFEKKGQKDFEFEISKEDIMKEKKKVYSEIAKYKNYTVDFKEKPMSINNINGSSLTIKREFKVINAKSLHNVEKTTKYFIWQDENIWYSIRYYEEDILSDSTSSMLEYNQNDIQKVVSSIKYPSGIKNVKYISDDAPLMIYGNKDLNTAEKMLGFKPKFPLSLPMEFYPTNSVVSTVHYRGDSDTLSEHMETRFSRKDKDTSKIRLDQIKNPFLYNGLEENGYVETEDYKTYELIKVKVNTLELNNVKVFTYEKEVRDYLSKSPVIESIKERNYVWKQEDIVYTATFTGNIGNEHEIVKTLINEPQYVK